MEGEGCQQGEVERDNSRGDAAAHGPVQTVYTESNKEEHRRFVTVTATLVIALFW